MATEHFFKLFFRICYTISRIFVANYFLRPCLKGLAIPVILSQKVAAYDCYYWNYGQIKAGKIGENSVFLDLKIPENSIFHVFIYFHILTHFY